MARFAAAAVLAALAAGPCSVSALTLGAGRSSSRAALRELARGLENEAAPTPIQRVVKLLEEMKGQLESEASADAETYDKMVCWCQTNEKEKTKAIDDAETQISELEAEVGQRAARDGEVATMIQQLKRDLAERKASLETAVALREKEHGAFNSEEVELVQGIAMLRNAIEVLSKHNAGLLQISPGVKESLGAAIRWATMKREEMLELKGLTSKGDVAHKGAALLSLRSASSSSLASQDRALLKSLMLEQSTQLPTEYAAKVLAEAAAQTTSAFVQEKSAQPAGFQSYAPQSNQIFGVLQQMQEEFEGNLAQSQEGEKKAQEDFTGLKAALETEIETSSAKLDELEADFGANTKALSDAKEDLTSTREQRSEDVTFLSDLNLKCKDLDHQYQQRSKARGEEIRAVGDAVKILTEDDARTLFQKNMGTGSTFLQIAATSKEDRMRVWASAMLLRVADKLRASAGRSWIGASAPHEQLTAVALQVQLDAFTEVKKAIDVMVAELKTQMKAEVDHKAFCTKSLGENEKETYHTKETLEDITDHIAALEDAIQKLQDEIAQAHEAITNMEVQLKAAGELRKQENAEFQEEVMDQRTMQQILDKAIKRMKLVYKESLLQEEPAPPVQFQPHKESSGGSLVIGLMEQIVEDSKTAEAETAAAEQAAQTAYSEFVNDSESAIRGLNKAIEEKTKVKAQTEVERSDEESAKLNTEDKLESLEAFAADMHAQCDFVLKNFDVRQTARLQEIEALGNVKVLLSGMTADNASR